MRIVTSLAFALLVGTGCGAVSENPTTDGGSDDGPAATVAASCVYTSVYSGSEECRDYTGAGWTPEKSAADCATLKGRHSASAACSIGAPIGRCVVSGDQGIRVSIPGAVSTLCVPSKRDCALYLGGVFQPGAACADALPSDGFASGLPVFEPPVRECKDPLPGEPPGKGPDGQVCTWSAISASTEEGRRFADYASCERVLTQRPYYPVPAREPPAQPDTRLQDPVYAKELAWVKSQIEASACVCCHSQKTTPRGTSQWYIEAAGNFMDSFHDSGLSLGANFRDSTAFGAYDPALNNGFDRVNSGFPSTDPARMVAFFVAELKHRGKAAEDFAGLAPFGGPLATQMTYQPKACTAGEGVDGSGRLVWSGGPARYVYVLDEGSKNPAVPPNLDLPAGTRWRFDVPFDGNPVRSGTVTYGTTPSGATQRFPANGATAAALETGRSYYLYVLADVGVPITRCVFTR